MNNHDYEKARQECWDALRKELLDGEVQWQPVSRKEIVNFVFDRAYSLGKKKETITQEEIKKAAEKYTERAYYPAGQSDCHEGFHMEAEECLAKAFKAGANFALGKQERDAEKKPSLTDKEVYALKSAISELESLMDGTLDEDYHKENKIVINALKRIIKKYEKK